jgi:tetratricopeptide (TPR) repeat protein
MDISGQGYRTPRSTDEFERLCLKLLRRHWQIPQLERLRDPERRDKGIHLLEISGRPRLAAVRCDLREADSALSANGIRDAAELATSFGLPIGRFVIATTARRNPSLKRTLYDVNRGSRSGSLGAVEVITWDDIEQLLDEYPQLLTEFGTGAKRDLITQGIAAVHLQAHPVSYETLAPPEPLEARITQSAQYIGERSYQMARLELMALREQNWAELSAAQKFRVLTNLAVAWLGEGEPRKAAMLFIAARSLQPGDELACTNEALAHELLGEHDRAHALADRLRIQFPSSARALALWLNNAPLASDAAALELELAPELGADAEVAIVMARRSIAGADYPRAERYARAASQAVPNRCDPWLMLGQALLFGELTGGALNSGDVIAPEVEARLREAESCFTEAAKLAGQEAISQTEGEALIGRAQARIALRDTDGAGNDIEQAQALRHEDAGGLVEYGIVLRARGSLGEAIEVFRRAIAVGGRDDAEYHLAITLRERDDPGDLQEATDLLVKVVARPESVPKGEYPSALAATADVLARLERWHEADAVLTGAVAGAISPVQILVMRANLRFAQGKYDKASELADQAAAAARSDASGDDRRRLAALLHDLGRYGEALPLWQVLSEGGSAAATRRLLDCALRLGRDVIALEIAEKTGADIGAPVARQSDLERLERHDPRAALEKVEAYLEEHPEDATMRLRRSILADRLGQMDLVISDPNAMPPARSIAPALGREAVRIMREGGRASEALTYAYDLIRSHPREVDAHRAYLAALGPIGAMPHVPDYETAVPGTCVCFVEQETSTERWVTLEDASEPDEALDEYGPSHAMTKALKGKRVGDKFQLPEGRFSRKAGVVKQTVSKYAWRYQDCLREWSRRFPGLPEIEMMPALPEVVDWDAPPERFDQLFPQPRKGEEQLRAVLRGYVPNPIPLHLAALRLGYNDLQTTFLFAQNPDAILKCCLGSSEELDEALGAFERANGIVIDLTAIATLCLLGRLSVLATWPRQFIVSQGTLAELRRVHSENLLLRLPPGFSASINGNGNDGRRADLQLKGLADTLQSVCRVRDGSALATVEADRRERLVRWLGRHGAESVVLASMPGHVLWSDDRILAGIARKQFGVRRVWTEAAMQARVRAGCLDPAELATASTKLSGWGYTFTTPSVETLMRAGSVAMWNPDQFPLRQALDQFAAHTLSLSDAVRLAAELIVRVYSDQYLRAARRTFTMRLLDRIASRPGGREAIAALPRSMTVRFGLDLIHARELSDVIRGWMSTEAARDERDDDEVRELREDEALSA